MLEKSQVIVECTSEQCGRISMSDPGWPIKSGERVGTPLQTGNKLSSGKPLNHAVMSIEI
jgi:hypothetical protein